MCQRVRETGLAQAKTNPVKPWESSSPLEKLLEELPQLDAHYPGVKFSYRVVVSDPNCKYPTALLHALFQFREKVQMFGAGHLNQRLQDISMRARYSSVMSLMPVDFRPDNLLALAVLASFDDKSSPERDHTWLAFCKGAYEPKQEVTATTTLPTPPPPRPSIPMMVISQYEPKPSMRARSRTPPRTARPTPDIMADLPPATGRLLESVADLWRASWMQDFPPGSKIFKDQFRPLELLEPEWICNVLEYDADPLYQDRRGMASMIFGSSVIRCLKIFAKAMQACAASLNRASKAVVCILQDALDPLSQLVQDLFEASEACKGIIPVVEAFRHMKAGPSFHNIGAKPDTIPEAIHPIMPIRVMPTVFQSMSEDNRIKNMYRFMFMASTRLEETYPDDDVYICWDRIARNLGELQQYLFLAYGECEALFQYCRR